jgi:hypothetical protein
MRAFLRQAFVSTAQRRAALDRELDIPSFQPCTLDPMASFNSHFPFGVALYGVRFTHLARINRNEYFGPLKGGFRGENCDLPRVQKNGRFIELLARSGLPPEKALPSHAVFQGAESRGVNSRLNSLESICNGMSARLLSI